MTSSNESIEITHVFFFAVARLFIDRSQMQITDVCNLLVHERTNID